MAADHNVQLDPAQWLRRLTRSTTHPIPLSWDYIFSRGESLWMIFHLKNGKMVGGYFSSGSFASGYPDTQEIYVQEMWSLDEFGKFKKKIDRTAGGYIKAEDCDFIEFLSE